MHQILWKDKMKVCIMVQKCAINGVGSTQGYPKRFVKVDISKKYSDAIFRIIWFFTVKMTPGPNNNMLGCLKMVPWDSQNTFQEKWTRVPSHACQQK